MNTMIGYRVGQEADDSGKPLQSLLWLVRNFLNQSDSGIHRRQAWYSQEFAANVPPRVWRRHSALLSMLVDQAESAEVRQHEAD